MIETKELIFNSMRKASEYFGFPYDGKTNERNDKYLSCYCEWERISRNKIRINKIYNTSKEFETKCTREYKYKVGDVIYGKNSSFKVLDQIRIYREKTARGKKDVVNEKGYFVECIKDGYRFEILESSISRNDGCPVCSNRKVVKGINDVATTHPEIAKYFENVEETYTATYSSGKKKRMKCPRCGYVKLDTPNHISYFGFSCPCCSDGISYPNKFMAKLLQELNIEFDREITFEWCKYPCYIDNSILDYGSYDFVIPDMHLIIEMDGDLGHGKSTMNVICHNRRKISIDETLYRDKMKDELAYKNGYKMIRINCSYQTIKDRASSIIQNIKVSELSKIFNFDNINFDDIDKYCIENSYIVDASNLWNKKMSVKEISKQLKISKGTIADYLCIGEKQHLCNYNIDESFSRSYKRSNRRSPYMVIFDKRKEVFSSVGEIIKYYQEKNNIKLSKESIRRHEKNRTNYHDRIFIKISQEEFNKYYNDKSLADIVVGEAF